MRLDVLTIGEALVEVMRSDIDQLLNQPGPFVGPYPSGAPFIFAVQAARLGLKTGAIGSVGEDAFGECLRNQLIADSISTEGLRQLPEQTTGIAFVAYQADGSRNYVFSLGAGGHLHQDMLQPSLFEGLRCFHIMGSTLSISETALQVCRVALDLALEAGALISFDPNLRPELLAPEQARLSFAPFIAAADLLLPTEDELLQLTGQATAERAIATLQEQKKERIIAVTRGKDGCSVYAAGERLDVSGFAVDELDPTGAGDCFDAGLVTGLLEQLPLFEAARLANACGALAVTAKGPMAGAKTRAEVESFMAASQR